MDHASSPEGIRRTAEIEARKRERPGALNDLEQQFFDVEGRPPDYKELAALVDSIRTDLESAAWWLRNDEPGQAGPFLDRAITGTLKLLVWRRST